MRLLIVIPTYNEIENISALIPAVFAVLPADNADILVVDDNSPDGTAQAVEKSGLSYGERLHLLRREGKQGLGTAYLAGFAWGIERGYDVFLEMDADFSHKPEFIPKMLEEIKTHDVIIGSRNIKGGSVEGWGALRNIISKGGSLYSRIVLGCPIKDLTGGFNMWTKSALEKINLQSVISRGYSFQIEMKYRAYKAGCSIIEIPIVFPDRQAGKSKMSKKIFIEAMLTQWKLRKAVKSKDTRSGFGEFWRFAITGGLGTISNLAIFFVCADLFNMPETPVSVGCFLITATQNYIINHKWSFKFKTASQSVSLKKWLQFIAASLFGLLVNIIVMRSILSHYTLPFKFIAQGCGIAAGMLINFAFSKFIVFRKHRN